GTCLGDIYELPTRMIRLTLREAGWNAIDLGCQVARQSLVKTATIMNAKIVWLSYSHISNSLDTVEENKRLRTDLPSDARLVVGGQALGAALRRNLQFDFAGDTLQHLRHYANQLRTQMSQDAVCAADLALV
ncbi:MAG: cobalamin-dependent protein, partial [Planctomycetales bacterium]|nr:cobalamin-dependent protein [Planctomycetales bacterium]